MRIRYFLFFMIFFSHAYGQTDTAQQAYNKKIRKVFNSEGFGGVSVKVDGNMYHSSGENFISNYPGFNFAASFWKIDFGINFSSFTNPDKVYYTLANSAAQQSTDYNYTNTLLGFNIGFRLASIKVSRSLTNLVLGYSMETYYIQDVKITDIKPLIGSTTSPVSVTQMGRTFSHQAFAQIQRMFWIANQQFSLDITGYAPISINNITPIGDDQNYYFPKMHKIAQVGIRHYLTPTFRYNPFKSNYL